MTPARFGNGLSNAQGPSRKRDFHFRLPCQISSCASALSVTRALVARWRFRGYYAGKGASLRSVALATLTSPYALASFPGLAHRPLTPHHCRGCVYGIGIIGCRLGFGYTSCLKMSPMSIPCISPASSKSLSSRRNPQLKHCTSNT
jgi:hypothetical protein